MSIINISEVAKMAGVSEATVSRVVNNIPIVKESTVKKVQRVVEELGYQPNALARGLRINETKTIGIVVTNILDSFFTSVVRVIEDIANEANYNIMLCNSDEKEEKERQYVQTLVGKRVDGLIVATTGNIENYDQLAKDTPVVFMDREPSVKNKIVYDTIITDNKEGSWQAVSHLTSIGYRRIAFVTGENNSTVGRERLAGYKRALCDAGISLNDKLVKIGSFLGHEGYRFGLELMTESHCDAIFVANNMLLMGVLKAANELNVEFPNNMGLAVFDDLEWMQHCRPQMTAVRQPIYDIGASAVRLLIERIAGSTKPPQKICLGVNLIVRDSSVKRSMS